MKHDLGQVSQAKAERERNGKDLKMVHFQLGTDQKMEASVLKTDNN